METVFELQSFRRRGVSYELVGEATRGEGRVPFSLAVDGETFQAIKQCVGPEDGNRYRLSLQCQWDPFRQQYFSSVTRIEQHRRRLLYFPCSTGYRDALTRLHDISFTLPPKPARSQLRSLKTAAHISILGFLLAVCMISLYYFNGADRAIAPHNRVVLAAQQTTAAETSGPPARADTDRAVALAPAPGPEAMDELPPPDDVSGDEGMSGAAVLETGVLVKSLPGGYAALTFDDGPSRYTREIVDILREHKVGATFFFIGLHALKYPEAVKYASDHRMVVGNHSWSHTGLSGKGPGDLRNEVVKTNDYLSSITDTPVTVFRPPFGHTNDQLINILADEQMKIVLWNRDPRDWNVKDARSIIDYVRNTDPSGGIYVLHENELTVQALPEIIRYLQQNNVEITVLR